MSHVKLFKAFLAEQISLCSFKSTVLEKLLLHFKQMNGFDAIWIASCNFRSASLKDFPHLELPNGPLPVWITLCNARASVEGNVLSQLEQLKEVAKLWISWCSFKPSALTNFISHKEHLFSSSLITNLVFICRFPIRDTSISVMLGAIIKV